MTKAKEKKVGRRREEKPAETNEERKARKRAKKAAKREAASLRKGKAGEKGGARTELAKKGKKKKGKEKKGKKKPKEERAGKTIATEANGTVGRADAGVSHRIEALLHTMRAIARREEELCTLAHEIEREGAVDVEVRKELQRVLEELPVRMYVAEVAWLLARVEGFGREQASGRV